MSVSEDGIPATMLHVDGRYRTASEQASGLGAGIGPTVGATSRVCAFWATVLMAGRAHSSSQSWQRGATAVGLVTGKRPRTPVAAGHARALRGGADRAVGHERAVDVAVHVVGRQRAVLLAAGSLHRRHYLSAMEYYLSGPWTLVTGRQLAASISPSLNHYQAAPYCP